MATRIQKVSTIGGANVNVFPTPIIAQRAPASTDTDYPLGQIWIDTSVSPAVSYEFLDSASGTWSTGGNAAATTTEYGTVLLTDNSEPVATKAYADALAIAGSPVSTDSLAGIGQLATDAEAVAGTASTGLLALFVTPSNLTPVFAAPPAIGGTTPASAAFTSVQASGVGTGNVMTSDTASSFGVTGAGVDVTFASTGGRVVVNGEEAAADAVRVLSAAGGLDVDVALQMNLTSSQNAADAIRILASAGGIDVDAVGAAGEDISILNTGGSVVISATESAADSIQIISTAGGIDILASGAAAGEDIDITATGSSVNITSTENNSGAIIVRANGGTSERVTLLSSQGTGVDSINLESTSGGITISPGLASADAINLSAASGGVDIDGALQVNIASSQNAVDAIRIVASAGGIDIDAVGAATEDINITNTGGSVVVVATESVADAIRMNASGAAGGFDIDAGTNGFIVDTTGAISLDSAAASNVTTTGAGIDLTLSSVLGSVLVSSTEDAALAIRLHANGGTSETIQVHSDQGTGVASVGLLSDVGGITLRSTGLASADAINLEAPAGGVDIDGALQINVASSQAAATAIQLTASDAAGGITATVGTGNFNIAGNLALTSVATQLIMNGGAVTDFIGRATLVAGTVTVANTNIAAGDRIFVTRSALNGSPALGFPITTISAGASFTIASYSATGVAVATDVSTFDYFIVRQT